MFTTLLVMRNVLLKCCTFVFYLRAILSIPKGWYPLYWNEKEMEEGKKNAVDVNGIKCYVEEDDFGDTFHGTFFTSWDYEVLVWDEMMSFRCSRKAIEDTTEDLSSLTITRASAVKSVGSDEDSKFAQDLNESVDCCIDATALKEKIMETVFFMDAEQFCFVSKYWFNNWDQHTPATKKDTDGKRYNTPALLHKSLSGEVTFVMRDGKRKHARVSKESRRLGGDTLVVKKTVSCHLYQQVPGDYRNWECESVNHREEFSTTKTSNSMANMETEPNIEAKIERDLESTLSSRLDSKRGSKSESSSCNNPESCVESTSQPDAESKKNSSSGKKLESDSKWDTTSWLGTKLESEPVWGMFLMSDLAAITLAEADEFESEAHLKLYLEPDERLAQGMNSVGGKKEKRRKRTIVKKAIGGVYNHILSCFRVVRTTQH